MRVINYHRQSFRVGLVLSLSNQSFKFPKKRKKFNSYTVSVIFYIVWITIVNKSSENKITFQEYAMTSPYLQMWIFLDWLCTIKEVCAIFFDVTFLKKELLKNRIIFAQFFHMEHMVFWLEIFFAIEIKKCLCTRSKKFCSIENFPGWKTAFKFPYDTNTASRILHRNIKRLWHGYIFRKYSNNTNISEILLLCITPEIL